MAGYPRHLAMPALFAAVFLALGLGHSYASAGATCPTRADLETGIVFTVTLPGHDKTRTVRARAEGDTKIENWTVTGEDDVFFRTSIGGLIPTSAAQTHGMTPSVHLVEIAPDGWLDGSIGSTVSHVSLWQFPGRPAEDRRSDKTLTLAGHGQIEIGPCRYTTWLIREVSSVTRLETGKTLHLGDSPFAPNAVYVPELVQRFGCDKPEICPAFADLRALEPGEWPDWE